MEPEKVKNIIFDLGGLFVNLDYDRTTRAFEQLGCTHFSTWYSQGAQNDLFDKIEKGQISEFSFLNQLNEEMGGQFSHTELITAWNAMLIDFHAKGFELLRELQGKYRLFLLSNTNAIHLRKVHEILSEQMGLSSLQPFFEKLYYSSEIGMRKPDGEIFEWVIKDQGLKKEETIFFDDSIQHIHGAASCGIQAFYLPKGQYIWDLTTTLGLHPAMDQTGTRSRT